MSEKERIARDVSVLSREELEDLTFRLENANSRFKDEVKIMNDIIDGLREANEQLMKEIEKMKMSSVIEDSEKAYQNGKADAYYNVLHDVVPIMIAMLKEGNEDVNY